MSKTEIDDEPSGDEVICPWCNHEHSDSWDYAWYANDHAEITCEECGKDFTAFREFTATYYSWRPKAEVEG